MKNYTKKKITTVTEILNITTDTQNALGELNGWYTIQVYENTAGSAGVIKIQGKVGNAPGYQDVAGLEWSKGELDAFKINANCQIDTSAFAGGKDVSIYLVRVNIKGDYPA